MTTTASPGVTAEDVERTGRIAMAAQWVIASVVMIGSVAAGGVSFSLLHENAALGVVTGLAVDAALASWLMITRRLRAVGVTSWLGVVLEVTDCGMALYLNMGAALFRGVSVAAARALLAIAHCFLPTLLVLVCLTFGDAQLKLLRLRRDREATEQADRDAEQARARREREEQAARLRAEQDAARRRRDEADIRRANGELVTAQDVLDKAAALRRDAEREQAEAAALRAATEAEVAATKAATEQLAKAHRKQAETTAAGRGKRPASREQRRQWVRSERAAGRNPTGAEVDKRFGPPRTGAAIVAEVDAELRRAAMHAVEGGR